MIILEVELPDIREVEERSSKPPSQNTNIFPNPATNTITLSEDLAFYESIAIYDMNGKITAHIDISSPTIDISNLNSGVYIVILLDDSRKAKTLKLLVTE